MQMVDGGGGWVWGWGGCFVFQAEEGIRGLVRSRGLGDVYTGQAYTLRPPFSDVEERHTLAVMVENEPGVLARVIGLFAGRGYNIESLTVAEIDHTGHLSRITVVTTGTPQTINQITAQLGPPIPI